ncbi:MAG: sulfotransferase [Syntrophobacteraceae bacterium]|jgi:hypothetical protein|nr:sulfotransferase [Syntrophobacteraceae bacterium]
MLPTFIIIGAMKAGTTSLYAYLSEHPDVFMSRVKETRFFAFDATNPDHVSQVPRVWPVTTREDYEALFEGITTESASGEASPNYLSSPLAPRRIRETIPGVKLMASLRNPADRIYSGYLMRCREGMESRPFWEAFQEDRELWWVASSFYYENLKRYYDQFERDRIKVILFEELKSDPMGVMKGLYRFIGVGDRFDPDVSKIYNKGGAPRNKALYRLMNPGARVRDALNAYVPDGVRSALRHLKNWNMKNEVSALREVFDDLINVYYDDIRRTEDLLRMDLSGWYRCP